MTPCGMLILPVDSASGTVAVDVASLDKADVSVPSGGKSCGAALARLPIAKRARR